MTAKVLIIDDSALSRRTLRRILESAHHQVIEAQDGLSGLERYCVDRPDLVLLDLTMAGMYGLDVLRKLREMDSRARVVVASADIQNSTREMAGAAGASAYVTKPFVASEVLGLVQRLLAGGENAAQ